MSETGLIAGWAGALFFVFGLIGFWTKGRGFWERVDPIYYSLAAVGVVLFFHTNADTRRLLELIGQRKVLSTEIADINAARPVADDAGSEPTTLLAMKGLFSSMLRYAEACDHSLPREAPCSAAQELAPVLSKHLKRMARGLTPEKQLESFCRGAADLASELGDGNGMSGLIGQELAEYYRLGLESDFGIMGFALSKAHVSAFTRRAHEQIEWIRPHVTGTPTQEVGRFMLAKYQSEAENAALILGGIGVCWRAPQAIRDGSLAKWRSQDEAKRSDADTLELEIKRIREQVVAPSEPVMFRWLGWPYVLLVALALKFGRGISRL